MYAVIETGSKQYRVSKDDVIEVELLPDANTDVSFEKVLLVQDEKGTKIGAPYVAKCVVLGQVLATIKAPKVITFKYRKRKDSKKKIGHRQKKLRVKITDIKQG